MKELSIEQKAKAYDEALEKAKEFYTICKKCGAKDTVDFLEDSFPELKESEDELTWLTKYIEREIYYLSMDIRDDEERIKLIKLQRLLDWVKKQCDKDNPTDEDIKEALRTEYEKGRADAIVQMQKEWSEKDEKILKDILVDVKFEGYNNDMQANSYKKINWLKSIKERYTWKPSDEQMKALDSVIDEYDGYPEFDSLVSLKNDLRKL